MRQFVINADDELSPEQPAELRRRADAVDRGEETLIPGEEVMRKLFERVGLKP